MTSTSNDSMEQKPSLVFVITDDQGYGDFSCHGNPIIETPNLDALHNESVRLTNLHVGPTCAPTRAGIMTGRYCNCTGVWHTIGGRSLLRNDERTMADIFQANSYRTGMFGKWHLGDNYPYRPHDRGFEESLYHGGGGISQTPDHWGNDYFDDTYSRNAVKEPFEGYCTDVWFDEAMKFIEKSKNEPFFCYLPTNAPHSPYHVPNAYSEPYHGRVPDPRANFYGMIANIDENVARLRNHLRELGIEDNTILIFMTDNGSAEGCTLDQNQFVREGFNAGRRGRKGSEYEGGHRVPLFMHWPNGGFTEGVDIDQLTANIDLLPTLIDFCQLETSQVALNPDEIGGDFGAGSFHGMSLAPLLKGEIETLPERTIVTDSQRVEHPIKWKQSATMTQRWRLINGVELYDIEVDPEQRNDIAAEHPEVVEELREHYEAWWELVSPRFGEDPPIVLGTEHEKESRLTTHDWHGEQHAWNQGHVRQGLVCNGYWAIEIAEDGEYAFELRRWPKEEDKPIIAGIPGEIIDWYHGGKALNLKTARLRVGDQEATQSIDPEAEGVTFTFRLTAGEMQLRTFLTDDAGDSLGAYYVYVTKVA